MYLGCTEECMTDLKVDDPMDYFNCYKNADESDCCRLFCKSAG